MEIICQDLIYNSQHFVFNSFISSYLDSLCPVIKEKKKYLSCKGTVIKLSTHIYLTASYK